LFLRLFAKATFLIVKDGLIFFASFYFCIHGGA
jgi:hypothetical protein